MKKELLVTAGKHDSLMITDVSSHMDRPDFLWISIPMNNFGCPVSCDAISPLNFLVEHSFNWSYHTVKIYGTGSLLLHGCIGAIWAYPAPTSAFG